MSDGICDICGKPILDDQEYERDNLGLRHVGRNRCKRPATTPTLMDAHKAVVEAMQPFDYAHRYHSLGGGTVIRIGTGGREINGSVPIEAIPLYTKEQVATLCAEQEAEVARLRAELASSERISVARAKQRDDAMIEMHNALSAQAALRARLADVLRPFANGWAANAGPDDAKTRIVVTCNELRAAAAALLRELEP